MAWRGTYKLTIAHEIIDEDLYNFPAYIHLEDFFYDVFSDVGADYSKVAVTYNDQRCYVEVVMWDVTNKLGVLCVRIPFVSSTQDTVIYLHHSSKADANSTYIGPTGTLPAKSVWDTNFIFVYHCWQPSGVVLDSTTNGLDGTAYSLDNKRQGAGHLGRVTNSYWFEQVGNTSYIDVGSSTTTSLIKPNYVTIEAVVNCYGSNSDWARIIDRYHHPTYGYNMNVSNVGGIRFEGQRTDASQFFSDYTGIVERVNEWNFFAGTYQSGVSTLYRNGEITQQKTYSDLSIQHESSQWLRVGSGFYDASARFFGSNFRLSNIGRTAAWVKATSASNWNTLFTVEKFEPTRYNVSVVGDYVYSATSSGVKISETSTGSETGFLPTANTSTVWANSDYIYVGTTLSGIHRYDTSLLTYLGTYMDFPDIKASSVKYLAGNGDHLCAVTESGINYIDTITSGTISTEITDGDKCFQTSSGQFYYTINKPYYYTSSSYWDYALEIVFDTAITSDNNFLLWVPSDYASSLFDNGSDLRAVASFGRALGCQLINKNFRGRAVIALYSCEGVERLYLFFGNTAVYNDLPTPPETSTTINMYPLYGFPPRIWYDYETNNDSFYTKVHEEAGVVKLYCQKSAPSDHVIDIYTDYFIGNASCTLEFTDNGVRDSESHLDLFIHDVNSGKWCTVLKYNRSDFTRVYRYIDNVYDYYGSIASNDCIGLKVEKISNTIMLSFKQANGTWSTLNEVYPTTSNYFGAGPFYFRIHYDQTTEHESSNISIDTFVIEADEIYSRHSNHVVNNYNSSYSEVHCIKNLSSDWTPETISHKFTANGGLINEQAIASKIKVSRINDIYVTENTSRHGGNTVFLGTNYGATVIEEVEANYNNSNARYYLKGS